MIRRSATPWEKARLGDVADISMGIAASKDGVGARCRFIQVRHLLSNGLIAPSEELTDGSYSGRSSVKRFMVQAGDIVLACRGAALRSGLAEANHAEAIVANNLLRIRMREDSPILPEVFLSWFRSEQVQTLLLASVSGPIGIHLRARDVEEFLVPVPPTSLQTELSSLYHHGHRAFSAAVAAAQRRRDLAQRVAEHHIFGEPQ